MGGFGVKFGWSAAAVLLAAVAGAPAQASQETAGVPDPASDPVGYGRYMAEAADCMPCHTEPGGAPFAGGRAINTPFGVIYSPNITPDKETGIGAWSTDDFWAAVHDGIGKAGENLYPAMPYTSYIKMTRTDVDAIHAYLMTVEPASRADKPNALPFPFNIRQTLGFWRELYFDEGVYQPDPSLSDELNRGAYLVEGPGHCGECHSPRSPLGGVEGGQALRGAVVDDWFAPNISSGLDGIGDWSDAELVGFLKTGSSKTKGEAFGPMAEVVHESLAKLADSDIRAIAAYLKHSAAQPKTDTDPVAENASARRAAATLYVENCQQCHKAKGVGIDGAVPALAGSGAVQAAEPHDVIQAIVHGLKTEDGTGVMPSFAAQLSDRQIAAITNYVRTSWGNRGVANATPELVAGIRIHDGAALAAAGREDSKALQCPDLQVSGQGAGVADPGGAVMTTLAGEAHDQAGNAIAEMISTLRKADNSMDRATMMNTMMAAYCPVVAADDGLDAAAKRAKLARFTSIASRRLFGNDVAGERRILLRVPVARDVLDKVDAKARAAKQTRDQWIAETLGKAAD